MNFFLRMILIEIVGEHDWWLVGARKEDKKLGKYQEKNQLHLKFNQYLNLVLTQPKKKKSKKKSRK